MNNPGNMTPRQLNNFSALTSNSTAYNTLSINITIPQTDDIDKKEVNTNEQTLECNTNVNNSYENID